MADQDVPAEKDKKVDPAPQAAPAASATAPASVSSVMLKGEIEIFPDTPLPHLDIGPIKAYAALTKTREKAFALVCERHLCPQITMSAKYYGISSPFLPRLMGAGTVDWAPLHQQRYVFVYENKLGKPVANQGNISAMNLKNDLVVNTVVKNLVLAIKEMRDVDFVHGNIRLANLFDGGGSGLEKVMLGECLSAPQGYFQSALYEPIERAAAQPLGRGPASHEDDMYAFGITLAVMLRGSDPLAGFTDDEIISQKIEVGSYAAVTGKERFTGSLLECLRGLLNDDARLRWNIDDVITWLEGRRVHPKQSVNAKLKASRPLEFNQEKYLRPQMLALDLSKNPKEAEKLVDGKDLNQWLNRSLQDKVIEERVEDAIEGAEEKRTAGFYQERLACYLSVALSPEMPLMFRGVGLMPQAFGQMMVEAVVLKKDLNPFVDIIQNQMMMFWISTQENPSDTGDLITQFDACRAFLRQSVTGYGIERCIYYMTPEAHCLSEKLKNYYVRSAEDLLAAFEKISALPTRPDSFFDRHTIAFLSVRDRQIIDPYIPDLNADEKHRNVLAAVRVLAAIQTRSKLPTFPGVTSWICETLDPLINRFHDRDMRTRTKAQLQKIKDKGDISKISSLFDNPQLFPEDFRLFKLAIRDYNNLRLEHRQLSENLETNTTYGHGAGRQTAAAVSGAVATFIILIYMVYRYAGSSEGMF